MPIKHPPRRWPAAWTTIEERDYFHQEVRLTARRIELLCLFGAGLRALRDRSSAGSSGESVREICRQIQPLVDRFAPAEARAEWAEILGPERKE